jgi:hypothetical protein
MASKIDRSLAELDDIWDAAIVQALRAVDAHLARAVPPCDRVLTELRFELGMLARHPTEGTPN